MPTENSVRLNDLTLLRAQQMIASGDWPSVRIAFQKNDPFAISRDKEQLREFRQALQSTS